MPRTTALLAALTAILFLVGGCGGDDDSAAERIPFDAARAMGFAAHLADEIGARPAGSPAATAAAEYIAEEFANTRFGVFRLEFEYEANPNRPASVGLPEISLPAVTAGGSAAGVASGTAVEFDPGEAGPGDGDLAGKVAVVQRGGDTTFFEKYEAARGAGAVGLIIVNNEPGLLTADLGAKAEIPVVTMEQGDAAALLEAAASGETVSVAVEGPQLVQGTNVVARSRSAHACVYMMMANYDSLPGSPGADENASGVAVLLELAYQFAVMDSEPAVCFIAMDAGYARAAGALAYIQGVAAASRPAVVISLHGVGGKGDLLVSGDSFLVDDALDIADNFDLDARDAESAALASPATGPFRALGIPVLEVSRESPVSGASDTLANLREPSLEAAGQIAGRLLQQLSAKVEP